MKLPFSTAFISDSVSSDGKLLDIVLRLGQAVFEVCLSYMKGFFFFWKKTFTFSFIYKLFTSAAFKDLESDIKEAKKIPI